MKDDKILEMLQDSAKDVEVPDSLKPENIEKKLESQKKVRKFPIYRVCGAVAAMAALGIGIWTINARDNMPTDTQSIADTVSVVDEPATMETTRVYDEEDLKKIESPANYEELYAALKDINSSDVVVTDEVLSSADLAAEEAETAADSSDTASQAESNTGGADYAGSTYSNTNLRTEGVDEGDIVKTDGTYIYVLHKSTGIHVINAASMEEEGTIALPDGEDNIMDMYLDGTGLYLVSERQDTELVGDGTNSDAYEISNTPKTILYAYDVSNPARASLAGQVSQEGYYATSRKVDGYVYLFTRYETVSSRKVEEPATYVPQVNDEILSEEQIILPEVARNDDYLVISSINTEAPDRAANSISIISGTELFYVSDSHIFIANSTDSTSGTLTQIMSIAYDRGDLKAQSAGSVPGYLNDSFSLDEYEGYLRVVSTQDDYTNDVAVNNLYVLDDSLDTVGKIVDLAPDETIRSARFMGDTGYFVTFRQMDPLFSVDLTNPEDPKIIGELKIPGFSSYLHPYGENLLLGIGWNIDETGSKSGLKLSMFDISDPSNVEEIDKMIIKDSVSCPGTDNYKAVMIDPEKNLFGLAYVSTPGGEGYQYEFSYTYSLFSYEKGTGFTSPFTYDLESDYTANIFPDTDTARGLYIDDTFYLSWDNRLYSFDMTNDYAVTNKLTW